MPFPIPLHHSAIFSKSLFVSVALLSPPPPLAEGLNLHAFKYWFIVFFWRSVFDSVILPTSFVR